jgi:ubiquinol-cytochrome c reductase cytochrome b subunit
MTSTNPTPVVEPGRPDRDSGVPIVGPGAATEFANEKGAPTWTGGLRRALMRKLPPDKLLPERQPAYVASWIYIFGVATLAAFLVILATGLVLAFAGPAWYHTASLGHFTNSMHFWSVQLFFVFIVVHLWGKFWMAAWRGRRVLTWITGVVAFLASIGTAFTGYLVQTNFDSQWISFEAKDGLNAVGIGAFFNVANLGQMLLLHACLLPLVVGIIVVWHVLLVRRRGVVPPIDAEDTEVSTGPAATGAASEATS